MSARRADPGKKNPATPAVPKPLADLSETEMVELSQADTLAWHKALFKTPGMVKSAQAMLPGELERFLQDLLGLKRAHVDMVERIKLDLFVSAVAFARTHAFAPQQLSAFVTLLHTLLCNVKDLGREENMAQCKAMLAAHAPASLKGDYDEATGRYYDFPPAVLPLVLRFVSQSLFQHYAMYRNLLTTSPTVVTQTVVLPLPSRPFVPRLVEALPQPDVPDTGFKKEEEDEATKAS